MHHPAIHILPSILANQIAAGEVIERPANVIKELVENSLDAQAKSIQIQIEDGGQRLLSIQDNGHGIAPQDLELALTRHATSKLNSFEDLNRIASYGFRGEALPSIASVSELRIESRQRDQELGSFLHMHYGKKEEEGPLVMPFGTRIEIKELFTNLPARLKFLKSPASEQKRCFETLLRLALAQEQTEFILTAGSKELLRIDANCSLHERLEKIWPITIVENLLNVDDSYNDIRISGLISAPQQGQIKSDKILFYVNKRPVQDKLLLRALRNAYKGQLTSQEYPQAVLFIELAPDEVDMNVHPAKTEVRFRDESGLFSAMHRVLGKSLQKSYSLFTPQANSLEFTSSSTKGLMEEQHLAREIPNLGFWGKVDMPRVIDLAQSHEPDAEGLCEESLDYKQSNKGFTPPPYLDSKNGYLNNEYTQEGADTQVFASEPLESNIDPFSEFYPEPNDLSQQAAPVLSRQTGEKKGTAEAFVSELHYLGQVHQSYLLLLYHGDILLIDQHAAHEKVLNFRLEQGVAQTESQILGIPYSINLHWQEYEILEKKYKELKALGYLIRYTETELELQAIPSILSFSLAKELLADVLAGKAENIDEMLHSKACHSAIKAGQELTYDEAMGLLHAWAALPEPMFCPHGRPIVVQLTKDKLERLFKRKL